MRPIALLLLLLPTQLFALQPGDVLVTGLASQGHPAAVVRVDARTGVQTLLSLGGLLGSPTTLLWQPDGLVIADAAALGQPGRGALVRVDVQTGTQTWLSRGGQLVAPTGLVATANGTLYVADPQAFDGRGGVLQIDPRTGEQRTVAFAGRLSEPTGLALAEDGALLVADPFALGDRGALVRIDPHTGTQTLLPGVGLRHPIALGRSLDGWLVADPSVGQGDGPSLRVVDALKTDRVPLRPGRLVFPVAVAPEAGGTVVVADRGQGLVLRVDPADGHADVLTSGGFLDAPCGIIVLANQVSHADRDRDGIPDADDQCPGTPSGAVADRTGCSLSQRVPCNASRAAYAASLGRAADRLVLDGRMPPGERLAAMREAASACFPSR